MRRRYKKGTGTGIIVFVVLCIFGIVAFGRIRLEERKKELDGQIKKLESRIDEEKERALILRILKRMSRPRNI